MSSLSAVQYPTAASLGLSGCSVCGQLNRVVASDSLCRHCGMRLTTRKPNSLARSWAFLLAAVVLIVGALEYFPALSLGPLVEHFQMLAGKLV